MPPHTHSNQERCLKAITLLAMLNEQCSIACGKTLKKKKTCTVFLSSYRNTSGSLEEREMLWEHRRSRRRVYP